MPDLDTAPERFDFAATAHSIARFLRRKRRLSQHDALRIASLALIRALADCAEPQEAIQ